DVQERLLDGDREEAPSDQPRGLQSPPPPTTRARDSGTPPEHPKPPVRRLGRRCPGADQGGMIRSIPKCRRPAPRRDAGTHGPWPTEENLMRTPRRRHRLPHLGLAGFAGLVLCVQRFPIVYSSKVTDVTSLPNEKFSAIHARPAN